MKLLLVESPAKCAKIESYLGKDYKCLSTFGHFRILNDLKKINFTDFSVEFSIIKEKSQQIKKVSSAIKKATEVILATDDDREGEAIAWHICDYYKLDIKTTKRIIFHEVTKKALLDAICNPKTLNMNIVKAQQCRQILDLIVGYKITPVLWSTISRNSDKKLSAGRCQTPALKIIYERENEIMNQEPEFKYNTVGYFTNKNVPFELNYLYNTTDEIEDFLDKSCEHNHIITINEPRNIKKNPPIPLTTSGIQQLSNNILHLSPKDTMMTCQKLYENGYITYMRTESKQYSEEFIKNISTFIDNKYGSEYIRENISNIAISKESDEAHEAIRPTNIDTLTVSDQLGPREKRMYKMIWTHTIESCMSDAKGLGITIHVTSPDNHKYVHTCEKLTFLGWKKVTVKDEDSLYDYFLSLKTNSLIKYNKIISKVSMKNSKSHYTEAKLVQLLEEKGIGRPSTFSSLVDKIQTRGYVEKQDVKGKKISCDDYELENDEISCTTQEKEFGNEKNKLVLQSVGKMVLELLVKEFDTLFSYNYTEEMENNLDLIVDGKHEYIELCSNYNNDITTMVKEYNKSKPKKKEYTIDDKHVFMIGKYGPVIKCTVNEEISWKPVKKNIQLDDIINNNLSLDEIIEEKKDKILGTYKNEDVLLKKGKFGYYVSYKNKNITASHFNKHPMSINISDVINMLDEDTGEMVNTNIIRCIDKYSSIRNGKYGDYIYYKNDIMKKPQFIKLKGFDNDYKNCDLGYLKEWIERNKK